MESYFSKSAALAAGSAYWIGMQSPFNGQPFNFLDSSAAPQLASNSPYAHWSSQFAGRAGLGMGCVAAKGALAYDFYLGGPAAAEQAQPQFYQTAGTADKK